MSRALLDLEELLALSETMADAAAAQEWDDFTRLTSDRGALADSLPGDLAISLATSEKTRGLAIIERCRQLDMQTTALVAERQKSISVLLR